jgi:phosphoribosylformylglycinamidine synthase
VALAETAFAGGLGMDIDLRLVPRVSDLRDDVTLFSESASRFVITVHPEDVAALEAIVQGLPWAAVGRVTGTDMFGVVGRSGALIIEADIDRLKAAWQRPLNW